MEVVHNTPFQASLDAILDKDGSEARVAVLKATFDFRENGSLRISESQDPIHVQDVYLGEPQKSSVVYESDGAFFKPGADVVVIGSAFNPTGEPVKQLGASLRVGKIKRDVTVIGDRVWGYGAFGICMSTPKPFSEMPICWERCFGGADTLDSNPKKHAWEQRNPIGTGFCITKRREMLEELALPNFENPRDLINHWNDKPSPHGLGYVGRSWMPRIRFAGTFDDNWQKLRMPILPRDFDYRFFNAAPPDLVTSEHLQGGEAVRLINLTRRGREEFNIPKMRVVFEGHAKGHRFKLPACLDTLQIKGADSRVVLIWRLKYNVLLNESADIVTARIERID
jgi:hypothetical protein